MWVKEVFLAIIGLSAGLIVAGGLFAFLSSLGVVSDIADRTHTGAHVLIYEDATSLGGILGNLFFIYRVQIFSSEWVGVYVQSVFGIFAGIFVGCWAMSLAETVNVFPIFIRRVKLVKCVPYIILSLAIGKGIGSCIYFFQGW